MERFYCPDVESGLLEGAEARHCLQVLRHKVGDTIGIFDGKGREWSARITTLAGKKCQFHCLTQKLTPPANRRISLVQAIPKGKAMDLILQKATELGVSEIIPVLSERSVARVEEREAGDKAEKWRETIIEAAKQCGQNWLPLIRPPVRLSQFFQQPRPGSGKLIGSLQPEARPLKSVWQSLMVENPSLQEVFYLIGPEGDFTADEVREAQNHGYQPVTLGPLILRSDTAALYVLSVLRYEMGALEGD